VLLVAFWKELIEAWSAASELAPDGTKHSLREEPAVINPPEDEDEDVDGAVVVVVGAGVVVVVVGVVVVVEPPPVEPPPVEPPPVEPPVEPPPVEVGVVGIVVDVVDVVVVVLPEPDVGTVNGVVLTGRPTFFPSSVSSNCLATERQSRSTE
jgi:hypothetical protein